MSLQVHPTMHRAVLPAGVPERATDFFGLKAACCWSTVVVMIRRFSQGSTALGCLEELVKLLLVGIVAEKLVELSARLHQAEHIALRTFRPDGMVHLKCCGVHRPVSRAAEQNNVHPGGAQLLR